MEKLLIKTVGWYINISSYISKHHASKKALTLFQTPRQGRVTDKQSSFLNTAVKQTLKHNNLSIMTYQWKGTKETILLVHGWESNAHRWKSLVNSLTIKGYNLIALDAPAHGASGGIRFNALLYAEFIHIVAKHFNAQVVIGHSVGGMASVLFQHKYNIKSVEKLILMGAPSEFKDVLERYYDLLGYNKRTRTQINLSIINLFGKAPEDFSTAKFSKQISSQGLIIHDTEDAIIPYNDAILINKDFSDSQLITTTGFGHSLNNDTINNFIYQFIDD